MADTDSITEAERKTYMKRIRAAVDLSVKATGLPREAITVDLDNCSGASLDEIIIKMRDAECEIK